MESTRRAFLEQVGQGVLLASVGSTLSGDLGLASIRAADGPSRLNFGKREPLVQLIQETPPAKILPLIVDRLNKGTDLKNVVAAAALANARHFGGEDYDAYHTMMALAPSYAMSLELPAEQRALPVLKVLYRNCGCIAHAHHKDTLLPVEPADIARSKVGGELLREQTRNQDKKHAEGVFAALARGDAKDALNELLYAVDDDTEVHRVVLAYRSYDMLGLVGTEHAHTLLRQSVRYCVDAEKWNRGRPRLCRTVLPKMLEKHKLLEKTAGKRRLDDAGVRRLSEQIFKATPEQAAGLAAEALADGILPDDIGEAITLAAVELLLRDNGRPSTPKPNPIKPPGSVHGDSIGLHATDSANAWRNIARVSNWRNTAAALILGAFQVPLDRVQRGGDFLHWEPYPRKDHREKITASDSAALLREAEGAIKEKDQGRAAGAVHRYLELGQPDKDVFALLLQYAISEDGALHNEKFYRTASEEHSRSRAAHRGRFLIALARVAASAYGRPAPGLAEARRLLKV
jgi:hypothetical protein